MYEESSYIYIFEPEKKKFSRKSEIEKNCTNFVVFHKIRSKELSYTMYLYVTFL